MVKRKLELDLFLQVWAIGSALDGDSSDRFQLYGYFYWLLLFCATFMKLWQCVGPTNCALHVQSKWTILSGHRWNRANFPSREVQGWLVLSWLVNVVWLFSPVISIYYKYSSSFCKDASGVCKSWGQTQWFSCFRGMTYVALTLCFKLFF